MASAPTRLVDSWDEMKLARERLHMLQLAYVATMSVDLASHALPTAGGPGGDSFKVEVLYEFSPSLHRYLLKGLAPAQRDERVAQVVAEWIDAGRNQARKPRVENESGRMESAVDVKVDLELVLSALGQRPNQLDSVPTLGATQTAVGLERSQNAQARLIAYLLVMNCMGRPWSGPRPASNVEFAGGADVRVVSALPEHGNGNGAGAGNGNGPSNAKTFMQFLAPDMNETVRRRLDTQQRDAVKMRAMVHTRLYWLFGFTIGNEVSIDTEPPPDRELMPWMLTARRVMIRAVRTDRTLKLNWSQTQRAAVVAAEDSGGALPSMSSDLVREIAEAVLATLTAWIAMAGQKHDLTVAFSNYLNGAWTAAEAAMNAAKRALDDEDSDLPSSSSNRPRSGPGTTDYRHRYMSNLDETVYSPEILQRATWVAAVEVYAEYVATKLYPEGRFQPRGRLLTEAMDEGVVVPALVTIYRLIRYYHDQWLPEIDHIPRSVVAKEAKLDISLQKTLSILRRHPLPAGGDSGNAHPDDMHEDEDGDEHEVKVSASRRQEVRAAHDVAWTPVLRRDQAAPRSPYDLTILQTLRYVRVSDHIDVDPREYLKTYAFSSEEKRVLEKLVTDHNKAPVPDSYAYLSMHEWHEESLRKARNRYWRWLRDTHKNAEQIERSAEQRVAREQMRAGWRSEVTEIERLQKEAAVAMKQLSEEKNAAMNAARRVGQRGVPPRQREGFAIRFNMLRDEQVRLNKEYARAMAEFKTKAAAETKKIVETEEPASSQSSSNNQKTAPTSDDEESVDTDVDLAEEAAKAMDKRQILDAVAAWSGKGAAAGSSPASASASSSAKAEIGSEDAVMEAAEEQDPDAAFGGAATDLSEDGDEEEGDEEEDAEAENMDEEEKKELEEFVRPDTEEEGDEEDEEPDQETMERAEAEAIASGIRSSDQSTRVRWYRRLLARQLTRISSYSRTIRHKARKLARMETTVARVASGEYEKELNALRVEAAKAPEPEPGTQETLERMERTVARVRAGEYQQTINALRAEISPLKTKLQETKAEHARTLPVARRELAALLGKLPAHGDEDAEDAEEVEVVWVGGGNDEPIIIDDDGDRVLSLSPPRIPSSLQLAPDRKNMAILEGIIRGMEARQGAAGALPAGMMESRPKPTARIEEDRDLLEGLDE